MRMEILHLNFLPSWPTKQYLFALLVLSLLPAPKYSFVLVDLAFCAFASFEYVHSGSDAWLYKPTIKSVVKMKHFLYIHKKILFPWSWNSVFRVGCV